MVTGLTLQVPARPSLQCSICFQPIEDLVNRILGTRGATSAAKGLIADATQMEASIQRMPLRTEFNDWGGEFSPDMHCIACVSNESGNNEVYVRPFSPSPLKESSGSGARWMVSMGGGYAPRWGRGGKVLIYSHANGMIMSVEIATAPVFQAETITPLFQLPYPLRSYDATADNKRFLSVSSVDQGAPEPFTVILNWQAGLKK